VAGRAWGFCCSIALALFALGLAPAAVLGSLLVDTPSALGFAPDGYFLLLDGLPPPASSRYWVKKPFDERFAAGKAPVYVDLEFLRLWFVDHCDPYNDVELPSAPADFVVELSNRYIYLYETITGG
jgi:Phosphoribosylaminoimidazolesuccinocarboxamide (SAICAR) synthase